MVRAYIQAVDGNVNGRHVCRTSFDRGTHMTLNKELVLAWLRDIPTNRETLIEAVRAVDGNGHTIWKEEKFSMLPDFVRDYVSEEYESDTSHPKSTISIDGLVVEKVKGIYGPRLLNLMLIAYELEGSHKIGRGFAAEENCSILLKHLQKN